MTILMILLALIAKPQMERPSTEAKLPPQCTGLTVVLESLTPIVKPGQNPRFAATVKNNSGGTARLLNVLQGRRSDLQMSYFEVVPTLRGRAVDVPVAVADPGPIDEGDFISLPAGRELELSIINYSRELSALPVGVYEMHLLFWRDPLAPATTRCSSSMARLEVAR